MHAVQQDVYSISCDQNYGRCYINIIEDFVKIEWLQKYVNPDKNWIIYSSM